MAFPISANQSQEIRPRANAMISQLTMMGYKKHYVLRAIEVHKKSKFGSNWNLSLLVEIIMKLKEKEKALSIFIPHFMSTDEPLRLNIGDSVDYRYENGRFILCCILDKISNYDSCILKIHPMGRPLSNTKYDKFCDIYTQWFKLATAKSISLRKIQSPNHIFYNYNIGHFIDINAVYRTGHEGWKSGQIVKLDPNSSQIKVLYHNGIDSKNYTYWVHLQNSNEVAEFGSKCKQLHKDELEAELDKDFTASRARLHSESIINMNYVRYSAPFMNKDMKVKPVRIPMIKNIFHKSAPIYIHNAETDVSVNNHHGPRPIPVIKDVFDKSRASKSSEFNNELCCVALGNSILLNDIVDEMDGIQTEGDMTDIEENNNDIRDSFVLKNSKSDDIECVHVMAADEEKKLPANISFKVREKRYDPNDNQSVDIDAIAFDDDEGIMDDCTTIEYPHNDNGEKKEDETQMRFYIDCNEYKERKQDMIALDDEQEPVPYRQCMTMDEIENISELDRIDHRNIFGKFQSAVIIAKDEVNKTLKIRYCGWTHQYLMEGVWNGWSATDKSQQYRFAENKSISCRKSHKWAFAHLRIGCLVELRPSASPWHELDTNNAYYGWQCAEIFKMDHKSAQIQCKYRYKKEFYLYWAHVDNESEITYIDNCYDIGDNICVYNDAKRQWMMANVLSIDMNVIIVQYIEDKSKEKIHVRFDEKKLLFPKLREDIKHIENAIMKEKLPWKLIKVTPTHTNTIYQCFAYLIYGDLNVAVHIKNECIGHIKDNGNIQQNDEQIIIALCKIYAVRIRIFEYKINTKRLNIVMDHGVDDLQVPLILLSKHLSKYYNIIMDKHSVYRIPICYQ